MVEYLEKNYQKIKTLVDQLGTIETVDQTLLNHLDDIQFFVLGMRKTVERKVMHERLP